MKKTGFARALLILLAMLTCVGLFASCGEEKVPDDPSSDTPGGEEPEPEVFLTFVAEGVSKCTVVYPAGNDTLAKLASSFAKTVGDYFGEMPDLNPDDFLPPDENETEILIGNTNRPESRLAFEEAFGSSDMFVGVIGKKLCLFGNTDASASNAVNYFSKHYVKTAQKSETGTLSVSSILRHTVRAKYAIGDVSLMGHKLYEYSVVYPKDPQNAENFYASYLSAHFGLNAGTVLPVISSDKSAGADATEIALETGSPKNTFTITAEGKRLIIRGNDMIDFDAAVYYIKKELVPVGAETAEIPAGYSYSGSTAYSHERKSEYRLMYHNIDGVEAAWNRSDYIRAVYKAYDPDFIGLNEYWFYLSSAGKVPAYLRELGYTEAVPTGLSAPNVQPVWYKADKFELLEVTYVNYTNGRNATDDSKAATIAVFKDKTTGKVLSVTSTHLASAYKDETSFYTQAEATVFRIEQVDMLHPALVATSEKYGGIPIFIGGDHNADFGDCQSTDPNDYSAQKPAEGKTFTDYPRAGALLYIQSLGYESARDLAAEKNNACSCHALPVLDSTYGVATAENGFFANETGNGFELSIDHAYVMNADKVDVAYYRTVDDILVYAISDHSPQIVEFSVK